MGGVPTHWGEGVGGGNRWSLMVPSNPNHSMILPLLEKINVFQMSFSRRGVGGLMAGLDDLGGFSNLNDSVILWDSVKSHGQDNSPLGLGSVTFHPNVPALICSFLLCKDAALLQHVGQLIIAWLAYIILVAIYSHLISLQH